MVTRYALLSTVLTIALTLPLLGQGTHNDTSKTDPKQPVMSSMLGKPAVDTAVGGVQMRVWLLTQEQHREIMKEKMGQMAVPTEKEGDMGKIVPGGSNSTTMATVRPMKGLHQDSLETPAHNTGKDNDTVDAIQGSRSTNQVAMPSGTHDIILDATEIASGKEVAGASARVLIESPSKKSSTVELKSMMKHFGSALTLDEKGEYRFTVTVSFGGVTKTTQFQYAVK